MDKKAIKAHQNLALDLAYLEMMENGGDPLPTCEICRKTGMSRNAVNRTLERAIGKLDKPLRDLISELRTKKV